MQNQKRQEIIKAIRDTAKNNGGEVLSEAKFEKETGIRPSEWKGVFWARWSDAVKDAGFSPRTEFIQRTEKSVLLEKIIHAIRHFGKIPTEREGKVFGRSNSYPSARTIRNRFLTKANLARELIDYAQGKPELQDIVDIVKKYDVSEDEDIKPHSTEGHVYLFKSGNHYKIGKTSNLERRVKEVAFSLPEPLTKSFILSEQMILMA